MAERVFSRLSWPVIALLTLAIYGQTLNDGLSLDDNQFVHRYALSDVLHAFVAPWFTDYRVLYYRPGAIFLFALRSWVVGANPVALHAINLVLTVIVVWLFGRWLFAWRQSSVAAWSGSILLLAHPFWSTSAVSWITNQMHLAEVGFVLGACWLAVVAPERWLWLLVLQACALSIKEDAVMLAPTLATLWLAAGVKIQRRWFVGSAILTALWLIVRHWAGSRLMRMYLAYSLRAVWVGPEAAMAPGPALVGLLLLGGLIVLSGSFIVSEYRSLLTVLALIGLWNLPLLYATGPTRWQFLTLWTTTGFALLVEGCARRERVLASALAFGLFINLTIVNIVITEVYFAPCGILERELMSDPALCQGPPSIGSSSIHE